MSPVVKESGMVDLSRDPVKYCGLKGEILSLDLKKELIAEGGFSTLLY